MIRKSKIQSGIYAFLEEQGVLQNGDSEAIEKAKALYYKQYRREWRKARRKANKSFEISFNDLELGIVTQSAAQHKLSKTAFLKAAALSYCQKKYLVPRIEVLYEVKELLALTYDSLQQLIEDNRLSVHTGNEALRRVADLESKVLHLLFNPNEKQ